MQKLIIKGEKSTAQFGQLNHLLLECYDIMLALFPTSHVINSILTTITTLLVGSLGHHKTTLLACCARITAQSDAKTFALIFAQAVA